LDTELLQYAKKVIGKAKLLYTHTRAAKTPPDGMVKDVIYPVIGEKNLDDLKTSTSAATSITQLSNSDVQRGCL
jgi:hypothetical protein